MGHVLVDSRTGNEISKGDHVTDFRGDRFKLADFTPGVTTESTGRVILEDSEGHQRALYPSVINAKIVRIPD